MRVLLDLDNDDRRVMDARTANAMTLTLTEPVFRALTIDTGPLAKVAEEHLTSLDDG